jgi:myo-inositol-1(or 4)-monophosphatase
VALSREPSELGELALRLARSAAHLVTTQRESGVSVSATKTSAVDIVTETDRAAEEFLRAEVRRLRPGDGFIGEEGEDVASDTGVEWIVDPIDGTVNFLYGIPRYAVCVAARLDGEVVTGAVVNVATGEAFNAVRGAGAHLDGMPIGVRGSATMAQSLFLTGFSYRSELRAVQGAAVARLLPQVRDIRRLGSAALDLCDIAAGRADAYVEEGLNLWDHAAAGLIAREAGAQVELLPGAGGGDCIVAAPAASFDQVRRLIEMCGFVSA